MYVAQLSKEAGVPAHVIRYYTQSGLLTPTRDPDNQYREYGATDVHRVRFIRRAKSLGFTLKDVKRILADADQGHSACAEVREIIESRLEEQGRRLCAMLALHRRMSEAVEAWKSMPDRTPDGHSVCHLIESVTQDSDSCAEYSNSATVGRDIGDEQWGG